MAVVGRSKWRNAGTAGLDSHLHGELDSVCSGYVPVHDANYDSLDHSYRWYSRSAVGSWHVVGDDAAHLNEKDGSELLRKIVREGCKRRHCLSS